MTHVILASAGTHGDVFPYVAIGKALHARGHRITLAVNESYRDLASDSGFEFVPLVSSEETNRLLNNPDVWHPLKSGLIGAQWGVRSLQYQIDVLNDLVAGSDCVVAASPAVIAARVLQEVHSFPLASIYHTPWMIVSSSAPPAFTGGLSLPAWTPRPVGAAYWAGIDAVGYVLITRHLNKIRKRMGLKPVRRLFQWWTSPDLAIGMFADWYSVPQADWPNQLKVAGFPLFEGNSDDETDSEITEFCQSGEPPVVFTFGTGMRHAERLFRCAVDVCRREGIRALLLARHSDQIPENLPDGIRHFSYAPLTQLLQHCSGLIHHGGIGTVAAAFATATPQVIVPHAWDQLDNAVKVSRLNAGVTLKQNRKLDRGLMESLRAIRNPEMKSSCQDLSVRMSSTDGPDIAAEWIEGLTRS